MSARSSTATDRKGGAKEHDVVPRVRHDGSVSKRGRAAPFSEVVAALKEHAPAERPKPPTPGLHDETLVDQHGKPYRFERDDVTPAEALALATAGALVAWDSCSCGGHCGLEWFGREEVRKMVLAGEPRIRKKNYWEEIWEMRSADGECILLVLGDVRWGNLLG